MDPTVRENTADDNDNDTLGKGHRANVAGSTHHGTGSAKAGNACPKALSTATSAAAMSARTKKLRKTCLVSLVDQLAEAQFADTKDCPWGPPAARSSVALQNSGELLTLFGTERRRAEILPFRKSTPKKLSDCEWPILVRETETPQASLLPFAELRRLDCMVIKLSSSVCCSECITKEEWKKTVKDRSK